MLLQDAAAWMTGIGVIVSILFYRDDSDPKYFDGKTEQIESTPWKQTFVNLARMVAASAVIAPSFGWQFAPLAIETPFAVKILAMLAGAFGMCIFLAGKITLGKSYSPCFKSYVPSELVTNGIYSVVRHPIYVGNAVMIGAASIFSGNVIAVPFFLGICALYVVSARREELALSAKFPAYVVNSNTGARG